ncbi:hypothetical protein GGF39_003682 [Coemansia sp. RSA 1721]|nr:hypothetical protein GGF39_003682 [Coemansia sp. RSA 1721]
MGWGITSNGPGAHTVAVMNRVDLNVAKDHECRKVDRGFASSNGPFICTDTTKGHSGGGGSRDQCNGDSGSPAVVDMGQNNIGRNALQGRWWRWRARRRLRRAQMDLRLVALTSYGDNIRHDEHPACGDPSGFGFSTHVAHYEDFITQATGLTRQQLEQPAVGERQASLHNSAYYITNLNTTTPLREKKEMSQRDLDMVKSKLKGIWAQYSSGSSANNNSAATVTSSSNGTRTPTGNVSAGPSSAQPVEELLLFPTYAYRDERLKVWRVQVRGWGFCRNANTRRVRLSAALMRRFIRIQQGGDSDQTLLDRVSYLFAGQPTSSDMVKVAMAGIAEPAPFELHVTHNHNPPLATKQNTTVGIQRTASGPVPPPKPPRANTGPASSAPASLGPVSLLDAPIVLTSQFDPRDGTLAQGQRMTQEPEDTAGHEHDHMVREPLVGVEPTIIQKALQIDAFSWQNLVLDEGLFQGEILLGFNELEWLLQSYRAARGPAPGGGRRLVELRGKLFGWPAAKLVSGLAHLVEPQGVSVVSDIDDTIKASNITAEKRILLETVFARPLKAVPGMAELYRSWYDSGCEFHYVSNSPWQLYPSLDDFFHSNKFPPGSAHLRSFDPNDLLSVSNYTGTPQLKRDTIEVLFKTFPHRKFVFVGDCGEHDLETYTDLARRFPDRVLRIYIRDVFAPMAIPTVTTDTDVAGNNVGDGLLSYGIMRPDRNRQIQNREMRQGPGSNARVDTDTDTGTTGMNGSEDLIDLDDDEEFAEAKREFKSECDDIKTQKPLPPPVPPKPAQLTNRSTGTIDSLSSRSQKPPASGSPSAADAPPPVPPKPASLSGPRTTEGPAKPPRRPINAVQTDPGTMPGEWTSTSASASTRPGPAGSMNTFLANTAMDDTNDPGQTPAERFEARVSQLREHAQEWMAFYAQKFYVAPTQSFLRYAHVFMPTVEQDMRIIDYDAVHHEMHHQLQQQEAAGRAMSPAVTFDLGDKQPSSAPNHGPAMQHWAGTPQSTSQSNSGYNTPLGLGMAQTGSFATFSIPEPPPVESQLARNARRLLLWKRYLATTRDLPPNMCRLFVDASDIKQDTELTDVLFPKYASTPQL